MKISKIASAVVLTMGVASFAAQGQGSGKVTFCGSIIDAPCSIKNGYGDQRIELGQISNTHLDNGGISTPRPFDIAGKLLLREGFKRRPDV
jgi:type 1 fimbria pilin